MIVETIAVLFTLLATYLMAKDNIICWPMSLIAVSFYAIVFYRYHLYGDLFLQIIFFIQAILGWIIWQKPQKELAIMWLSISHKVYSGIGLLLLYSLVFMGSKKLGGHMLSVDSAATALSIMATFLLIKKKIEGWCLWIVTDIVLIILFALNGLSLSAWLYVVFLVLAAMGLINWIRCSHYPEVKLE